MTKKYTAKIGVPQEQKQIGVDTDREVVVECTDVYTAHKHALWRCRGSEEVLSLTIDGVEVFNITGGFTNR